MEHTTPITFAEDETFDIDQDTRSGIAPIALGDACWPCPPLMGTIASVLIDAASMLYNCESSCNGVGTYDTCRTIHTAGAGALIRR